MGGSGEAGVERHQAGQVKPSGQRKVEQDEAEGWPDSGRGLRGGIRRQAEKGEEVSKARVRL